MLSLLTLNKTYIRSNRISNSESDSQLPKKNPFPSIVSGTEASNWTCQENNELLHYEINREFKVDASPNKNAPEVCGL